NRPHATAGGRSAGVGSAAARSAGDRSTGDGSAGGRSGDAGSGGAAPAPAGPASAPGPAVAAPKNSAAQARLNTPSTAVPPLDSGRNASARSCQVVMDTTASTRWSYAASSSAKAPPYEPPTTPTRGSPGPSVRISGRRASRSSSSRASRTS